MLNQLKRSLSLIFGLILCINSVWLLSQGQRHFAIALSIFIGVALILYALFFFIYSALETEFPIQNLVLEQSLGRIFILDHQCRGFLRLYPDVNQPKYSGTTCCSDFSIR